MTTVSKTDESSSRRRLVIVVLLLILLAAFALRAFHVDWADGQLPHPDERSTVAFYAPSIHWPPEGVSPLDKRQSPLNPLWEVNRQERRSYTYGHFPLYLLVLTANGVNKLAPLAEKLGVGADLVETLRTANGVPGFALVGRTIMAISDTFTVLLVFLLADRIYGRRKGRWWVGLLAAAFSAFTVLQIQLSHFFAVDPISTTFTVLALYGALRMSEDRSVGWSIVTGVGAGLAISSKFSALPILAAPVVAGLLMGWHARRASTPIAGPSLARIAGLVVVALAVAFVVFAVTSPFSILDWDNFKQAVLIEQGAMVRGEADFPFTRQYRGTLPYIYLYRAEPPLGHRLAAGHSGLRKPGLGAGEAAVRQSARRRDHSSELDRPLFRSDGPVPGEIHALHGPGGAFADGARRRPGGRALVWRAVASTHQTRHAARRTTGRSFC